MSEPSEPRPLRIVEQPAPSGAYSELSALALALGVAHHGAPALEVGVNGARATFALDINSGTVVGLTLKLRPEGPAQPSGPSVLLRLERAADVEGKERGINVEVQLDDPRFDPYVYIDSDATDAEVRRLLAAPAVRAAVRDLLVTGCEKLRLSGEGIEANWPASEGTFEGPRLVEALRAVLTVASAGVPRGRVQVAPARWLSRGVGLGLFGAVPYFISVIVAWPCSAWLPLLGALGGMFAALALRPALARRLRGASSSLSRYRGTAVALFFGLAFVGAALPMHLNGALDRAPALLLEGRVTAFGERDDEDFQTPVTVRWRDGREDHDRVKHTPEVGARVTQVRHPGWLGFTWWEPARYY